jgi:transposase
VIDYEMYCKIQDCHERQGLTIAQTARSLGVHEQTVATWLKRPQYQARHSPPRASQLDPFKAQIVRLLERHPYSAQQIFQQLREAGFTGGLTIVKDYVHKVRPAHREAFLKLSFAPGECAQLEWGLRRARRRPHYADTRAMPNLLEISLFDNMLPPF